jgi:protein-S-isoprenylcysteine O-methyltransferase Ste14
VNSEVPNSEVSSTVATRQAKIGSTFIQRWRVPLGFLCAIVFFVLAKPTPTALAIGGGVSVLGLALRGWAAGHIYKNSQLATSGPYSYTRNPLYLGSFLLGLGFTIASGRWILGVVFAALFLGIYFPVMSVEATSLARIFGEEYEKYRLAVPLFFPRLTPYRAVNSEMTRFNADLYLRYREYRAALGLIAAWSLLLAKSLFLK